VLDCRDADVRPGLINAHEHLHRNHYGRLGKPPYANAAHWARDISKRHRRRIEHGRGVPPREALLLGAWKNLFAGVTSVVHHDAWSPEFEKAFPLRVVRIANDDSVAMSPTLGGQRMAGSPYALHVAEGIDDDAAQEVSMIDRAGLLDDNLLAVHAVGPGEQGAERLSASGAALVWCPSSNHFLFGRTSPKALFGESTDVLLGSDSLLTAAGNLLDELRFARAIGHLDDRRMEQSIGTVAAGRLGLADPSLEPGAPADFILLTKPVLEARAHDVRLVVAGGAPRVAAGEVARQLDGQGVAGKRMTVSGVTRWVCGTNSISQTGVQ
jgi:cytosine/adenosine deaminase-related metal-dependent hydrolase